MVTLYRTIMVIFTVENILPSKLEQALSEFLLV